MSKFLEKMGLDPTKIEEKQNNISTVEEAVVDAFIEGNAQNENQKELLDEIEYVKGNMKGLIDSSKEAMDTLILLASSSESPKAFDSLSLLMKSYSELNKDYLHMAEKKKYTKEELPAAQQTTNNVTTNNNLIISTVDMLKMIKGEHNDK